MTPEERKTLLKRASGFKLNIESLKEVGGPIISIFPTLAFFIVLIWLFIAWGAHAILSFDFGLKSPYGSTIFLSIICLSFVYTLVGIIRCENIDPKFRKILMADIKTGKVLVEEYHLTDGKVFEEPEHGGFIYFFRTTEDRVFVTIDSESQNLAINEEDPRKSSFVPRNKLRLEKTPIAKAWLKEEYFGDELAVSEPLTFTAKTKIWPEFGEFIDVSWSEIESKYTD